MYILKEQPKLRKIHLIKNFTIKQIEPCDKVYILLLANEAAYLKLQGSKGIVYL
jgi:hypothetical protein